MYQKFECKVKYEKIDENGKERMVTESYLVEGVTFADVEQSIHEQLQPYISGEFVVDSIRRANYSEVHVTDGDRYFKTKLTFITLDEERGVEKRSSTHMLICAHELSQVNDIVDERMGESIANYEVSSVSETKIIDVFVLPEPINDKEVE